MILFSSFAQNVSSTMTAPRVRLSLIDGKNTLLKSLPQEKKKEILPKVVEIPS
jgi:hypothetical protein